MGHLRDPLYNRKSTRKRSRDFNRSGSASSARAPRALLSGALGKIDHCAKCVSVPGALRVNLHMPEPTRRLSAEPRLHLPKRFFARIRLEGEPLSRLESTRLP